MESIKRNVLLNPGPSTTTDTVKMAQVVPDICPREKEFGGLMKGLREDLVRIVHGDLNEYTSVLFCGSGTINIDVAINSLLPEGKKVLVVNNGAYSTRAVEICQYYELSVPATTSTNSTGIAERGFQGLISGKPVPCTLSTKSTTTSI